MKSLVIAASVHHGNTVKLARAIAGALGAELKAPREVAPEELAECGLVGFGSGIYGAKHHESLLGLAEALPPAQGRKAFIFSTCGLPIALAGKALVARNAVASHAELRARLVSAGFEIVGEFGCAGWNTNSFLKLFGGFNKGRPNAEDLAEAQDFARALVGPKDGPTERSTDDRLAGPA
jgi:flavodoxin